jgi:uncharacterized membrane protein
VNIKRVFAYISPVLQSPTKFFILIAGVFGLGFIVLVPPFQNPDEVVHFYRAYQITDFQVTGQRIGTSIGGDIPRSIVHAVNENTKGTHGTLINFNDYEKYRKSVLKQSLTQPLHKEDTVKIPFSNATINSPVIYAPQSLGIAVGKILNLSPVLLVYLARVFGLIFFIICVAYAIRLVPSNKWVFAGIACLPMVIAQASSITGDTIVYAAVFLIMATILYAQKNMLSMKIAGLLAVCFAVMAVSKQVFILLFPLIFLIPKKSMPKKLDKRVFVASVFAIMTICFAGWQYLSISSGAAGSTEGAPGSNMSAQKEMLLHHPEIGINAAARAFLTPEGNDIYVSLAGNFGWLHAPLPLYAVITVYILLLMLLCVRYEKEAQPKHTKTYNSVLIVVALSVIGATALAQYLVFTPVGGILLEGFQGRYVIPSIILIAGVAYGTKAVHMPLAQYRRILQTLTIFVLTLSMIVVYSRFYVV